MHDPMVVAHVIVRPWPQRATFQAAGPSDGQARWRIRHSHPRHAGCPTASCAGPGAFPWWRPGSYSRSWRLAGQDWYWPAMVTIWHNEPGGRDALDVCARRARRPDGTIRMTRGWRWHVHHWSFQVRPALALRRRLLTRCEWCGGRDSRADPVNASAGGSYDGPRATWWRPETGLTHVACHESLSAHRACLCDIPVIGRPGFGTCAACGKFRAFGYRPSEGTRLLAALPPGTHPGAAVMAAVRDLRAGDRGAAG